MVAKVKTRKMHLEWTAIKERKTGKRLITIAEMGATVKRMAVATVEIMIGTMFGRMIAMRRIVRIAIRKVAKEEVVVVVFVNQGQEFVLKTFLQWERAQTGSSLSPEEFSRSNPSAPL